MKQKMRIVFGYNHNEVYYQGGNCCQDRDKHLADQKLLLNDLPNI